LGLKLPAPLLSRHPGGEGQGRIFRRRLEQVGVFPLDERGVQIGRAEGRGAHQAPQKSDIGVQAG
jgi:hypothetical protein